MGSRRLMAWEMALVEADPAALLATAAASAARPGVRAVRPARPGGRDPDRGRVGRVRLLHRAGARGARGGGAARGDRADHVRRAPPIDRVPERPSDAASCAGRASASGSSRIERPAGAVLFIGDGESDRYAGGYSDIVFAKRSLERICLEAGWPFHRWTAFSEIEAWLADTLRRGGRIPRRCRAAARCAAAERLLLRPRSLGRGPGRSAARLLAAPALTPSGTSTSTSWARSSSGAWGDGTIRTLGCPS